MLGMEVYLTLFQDAVTITRQLVEIEVNEVTQMRENKRISEAELNYRVKEIAKKSLDADK